MQSKKIKFIIFLTLLLTVSYKLPVAGVHASRIDELKSSITDRNTQVQEVEKEIEQYQKQIDEVLEEKASLSNEIYRLELNAKKLNSDIYLTRNRIEATEFNIEKLELEISNKSEDIGERKESLAESIRNIYEAESSSLIEITLSYDKLSDFFDNIEEMKSVQRGISVNLDELKDLKIIYQEEKVEKETEKKKAQRLNDELIDQKTLVNRNKSTKNTLLKETKNKESNYRNILEEKIAKKEQFEQELADLESQLKIAVDPNRLPAVGKGVLAWPLDKIKITQYFGNTPFATKNAQVYNGAGHTGIDFRASVGTKVKVASSGVVKGIGNTDSVRGCYSYGKWILVEHYNGLSTLYSHLSIIKVSEGQAVAVGDLVGYSGITGYATGPHLHFAVYATQGVKITKFTKSINCKNAYVPIADKKAYLNPLSYL